ncbi:hypothetical protein E8E12_006272 [Didymella heteroderae]|uniref:Uncharacterized protein n=1 Tax=Didymella heteroderae TaxID=1769908 RepID=A0A9P4WVZ5_9PLEO|nr:hypothetical protein E8E12_006272 [Didymella heteroderae]
MRITLKMTLQLSASSRKNTAKHRIPAEQLSLLSDPETEFLVEYLPLRHSRRVRSRHHFRSLVSFFTRPSKFAEVLPVKGKTNEQDLHRASEGLNSESLSSDTNKIFVPRDCSCRKSLENQIPVSQHASYARTVYSELLDSSVMELPGRSYTAPGYAELPVPMQHDYDPMASTHVQPLAVHTAQAAGFTPAILSLSPQSTSQFPSPVSPFTPSTAGSISVPTHPRQNYETETSLHDGSLESLAHLRSDDVYAATMPADKTFHFFNPSAAAFFDNDFGFHATHRELLDFERDLSAGETPVEVR